MLWRDNAAGEHWFIRAARFAQKKKPASGGLFPSVTIKPLVKQVGDDVVPAAQNGDAASGPQDGDK
jgi:hypothetical protein